MKRSKIIGMGFLIMLVFCWNVNAIYEYLDNGGFETGNHDNWSIWATKYTYSGGSGCSHTFSVDSSEKNSGSYSSEIYTISTHSVPGSGDQCYYYSYRSQDYNVSGYDTLCMWHKTTSTGQPLWGYRIYLYLDDVEQNYALSTTGGWQSYNYSIAGRNITNIKFKSYGEVHASYVGSSYIYNYIDDVHITTGACESFQNNPPTISTPIPNNNTNVFSPSLIELSFTAYDLDVDIMTVDITKFHSNNTNTTCNYFGVSSGSHITCDWSENFIDTHIYNWTVVVSDGTDSYYGQYFFTYINDTQICTFFVHDTLNFEPINNVSIKLGTESDNLHTEYFTNSSGKAIAVLGKNTQYYYQVYHSDYDIPVIQSMGTGIFDNWTENIFLDYNFTLVNFNVHVTDLSTGSDLENVTVVVRGPINNRWEQTDSDGFAYFGFVNKETVDIDFVKTGYIPYTAMNYKINSNNQTFQYAMKNQSAWTVDQYNITINVTDNESVNLNLVDIHIKNTELGYDDWTYTNSTGNAYINGIYEGAITITLSKSGYDTLAYSTTLNSNLDLEFELEKSQEILTLSVFLTDKITFATISNADVCVYLKNSSGSYYKSICQTSSTFGWAIFQHIGKDKDFYITINHTEYPYTVSNPYDMDSTKTIQFELSNLFHTYSVYVDIKNMTGSAVFNSNIIVYQNSIKIKENQLIGHQINYDLKSDEKYSFTVSHSDYHTKTETIQNLNRITSLDINLTRSDQINPENPFNLKTYGWSDFFNLMGLYGLPLFCIIFLYFVYRTFTTKDK